MLFSFAAILIGLFSPLSSLDFIGLFILFLSFSVSVCGDILPALCTLIYSVSLFECRKNGLFLRDFAGVEYILSCDGIAVENTEFMKTGEIKLTCISFPDPADSQNHENKDELLSLMLSGADNGRGKFAREIIKAAEETVDGRMSIENFFADTQRNKPILEHTYDTGVHYSLYASSGDYYFSVVGSIDEVIRHCSFARMNGRDVPRDKSILTSILREAATASKSASVLIGAAVKRSPYNNMKRLSVLKSDLSFIGFIAVDTVADMRLSEEISQNSNCRTPLFFFTDGAGEDINFIRRLGIIKDRNDLVSAGDPGSAIMSVLSVNNKNNAVLANDDDTIGSLLLTARKAGKRIVSLGYGEHMKVSGFYVAPNEPSIGSGAYVTGSDSKMTSALLSSVRRLKNIAGSFAAVSAFATISATVRAIYALAAIFGFPFVYPFVILLWGMIVDAVAAAAIIGIKIKRGK
jgi:hypothetical protein